MATPYSEDLRERVVAAVEGGFSRHKAAAIFGIAVSTAILWVRRSRETGSVAAKALGGDTRSTIKGEAAAWMLSLVTLKPDLTLDELRLRLLQERGLRVSVAAVWRFLDKHRFSFKKNPARRGARAA